MKEREFKITQEMKRWFYSLKKKENKHENWNEENESKEVIKNYSSHNKITMTDKEMMLKKRNMRHTGKPKRNEKKTRKRFEKRRIRW